MLRLGGVASASHLTVFQGLGEMFKREGIDMDWVLSGISRIKPKGQEGCLVHRENNAHRMCTFVGCYILVDGVFSLGWWTE